MPAPRQIPPRGRGPQHKAAPPRRSKRHANLMLRMPPAARDHDAVRNDTLVALKTLADDVDIIETPFLDRQNSRIADAAGLEAAKLGPFQRECGIDGRCGNDVG